MLTLTRKLGQTIIIETSDGPIKVVLKDIRRNQVRLGLVAPASVNIDREEVYEARKAFEEEAAHLRALGSHQLNQILDLVQKVGK